MRVTVLDMQPIEPPVGGGRIRLFGLYHHLGDDIRTNYVGTFDWPGEPPRRLKLSETLTEEDVPLSAEHFVLNARMQELAGGMTVIDAMFPIGGRLSGDYLRNSANAIDGADIVVFSHPWLYPLLRNRVDRKHQLLVYDAHNAEATLRWQLLGDAPFNREVAKGVVATELALAREADLLVFCSIEDRRIFAKAFDVPRERTYFAPNGVFAGKVLPADVETKAALRTRLGLAGPVAIFIGSNYAPNVEAASYIANELCAQFPNITFVCCGGVGTDPLLRKRKIANLHLTGQVTETEKLHWLQAADFAINPMFAGSGTNIKMFDFMAAGLSVLATPTGARGISSATTRGLIIAEKAGYADALADLVGNPEFRAQGARANRAWAVQEFSWESISPALGNEFRRALARKRNVANFEGKTFSAIAAIPIPEIGADESKSGPVGLGEPPIAILSTFGIKCGIAEYTSYLVRQWHAEGRPVTILSSQGACIKLATLLASEDARGITVTEAWSYDNIHWKSSSIDYATVRREIEERGCGHLNVQYHPGFFKEWQLIELVEQVTQLGCPTSVTLHNSAAIATATLDRLAALGSTIFVHNRGEARRIALELDGTVHCLPMGVLDRSVHKERSRARGDDLRRPLIATFGFLRAHKGLRELILALPLVRQVFPELRLRALTALYPSEDSKDYLREILAMIEAKGLGEVIELDIDYHPIERVIDRLAEADVVVLPYAASDEGGSGSLATALAARRPLLISRARIFEELAESAYVVEGVDPNVLAVAILNVLTNEYLRETLESSATSAAIRASWKLVAGQMHAQLTIRKC